LKHNYEALDGSDQRSHQCKDHKAPGRLRRYSSSKLSMTKSMDIQTPGFLKRQEMFSIIENSRLKTSARETYPDKD
jgi:hypothetical protein